MLMLQLSAAHGPSECQIAVTHALRQLCKEAEQHDLAIEILEETPGSSGLYSALISLKGESELMFAKSWVGTIQWNCASPLRPTYPRKNWFIGVQEIPVPTTLPTDDTIVFTACKASGPGGQHVNATASAVQAKHIATGLTVKVQAERSQFANKRLARELLAIKITELNAQQSAGHKKSASKLHWNVERGNPVRIFKGPKFEG